MGEITEMMLDGTLCEGCGEFMGDEVGFPRLCNDCARDRRKAGREIEPNGLGGFVDCGQKRKPVIVKVGCGICKRKVNPAGLADHMRDKHGINPSRPVTVSDNEQQDGYLASESIGQFTDF